MAKSEDPNIAALLREREGYVLYGKTDRVKAVDEDLKRRGYKAPDDKPKARSTRQSQQETAD